MNFNKKAAKNLIASWLAYTVIRLLMSTYRIRLLNTHHRDDGKKVHPQGSICLVVWHEHCLGCIIAHRHQSYAPLASLSQDGDVATFTFRRFGYRTIRGSSSRGGHEARAELVSFCQQGWSAAITIDGPRGPRRIVKSGAIDIARKSGAAIVPAITVANREWRLRSWDKFQIPKPFAKVDIIYGPPIIVPPDTDGQEFDLFKQKIKIALEDLEHGRA